MVVKDMHYEVKKKLNKVDSQQYRNLLIPEIDWALNEAMNIFIDIVAEPRPNSTLGFEKSQKNIDDIRTIVVNGYCSGVISNSIYTLPTDYRYYVSAKATISNKACGNRQGRLYIKEHDDEFEESAFDSSSYDWGVVNGLFTSEGIKLFSQDFSVNQICLDYIRIPKYIHDAEDFPGGTYTLPSGTVLIGSQNCELPEQTHREIVDIAVLILTGEIQASDYNVKLSKLNLNNLK